MNKFDEIRDDSEYGREYGLNINKRSQVRQAIKLLSRRYFRVNLFTVLWATLFSAFPFYWSHNYSPSDDLGFMSVVLLIPWLICVLVSPYVGEYSVDVRGQREIFIDGKRYEVTEYRDGTVNVDKPGSAGNAFLMSCFLKNIFICPLKTIVYIFLVVRSLLSRDYCNSIVGNRIETNECNDIDDIDERENAKVKKQFIILITVGVLVSLVPLIYNAVSYLHNKSLYNPENVTLFADAKENVKWDKENNSFYFYIYVDVSNKSEDTVEELKGSLLITDINNQELATFSNIDMYCNIIYNSSERKRITCRINKPDNAAKKLWDYNLNSMKIYFKITSLTFKNGGGKGYNDSEFVLISKKE